MSDTEYDPSGNSNFSFHVGVDVLDLLFFIIFCLLFIYYLLF